jgi:hypothetical protein
MPLDLWAPVFRSLQQQFEAFDLPPGLHWVRYFYAHIPGDSPTIEVLVDNQPCESLMAGATSFPWPHSDAFYSARLFFTVQDAPKLPTTEAKRRMANPTSPLVSDDSP